MPNWCFNRLEVYGPVEQLARFKLEATRTGGAEDCPLVFSSLVPVPDGLESSSEEYNWCKQKWGTKWDLQEVTDVVDSPDQVTYTFDTADTPPMRWVETAAAMYPELNFDLYFYELGMFYAGGIECRRGQVYRIQEYTEESDVSDFIWETFQQDISAYLEANDR